MPIKLDLRLKTIADLVDYGTIADIGCDHGKLGYNLIGNERVKKVIATDISPESLKKAQELAFDNGVSHLMETRVGDGLTPINSKEVDTVVIAGMGGDLISEILYGGRDQHKEFDNYILSPNAHPERVRVALFELNQEIVYDEVVFVGRKYYTIIKSHKSEKVTLTKEQIRYGKFYKTSKNFRIIAEKELRKLENGATQSDDEGLLNKIKSLKQAIAENKSN